MKSLRAWLCGIALGAALIFSAPSAKAQVPLGFTYQGVLVDNGAPIPGSQVATFTISLNDKSGNVLWEETLQNQTITDGIFNIIVGGSSSPFPADLTFNEQYFMTVVVATTSNGTVTIGPTALESSPYAINSNTVNGISASTVPVAGDLFPVPIGSGYSGSAKMDPGFLPTGIPNSLLATPDITQINELAPNTTGNFNIAAGSGITITPVFNGITIGAANVVGNSSLSTVGFTVQDSEANGNEALLVKGGIGANNPGSVPDGTGLNAGSPQTYWADRVSVPAATGMSLQIFNTLIGTTSTIILTSVATSLTANPLVISAVSAGTFTVSATAVLGTGSGAVSAINYLVINH